MTARKTKPRTKRKTEAKRVRTKPRRPGVPCPLCGHSFSDVIRTSPGPAVQRIRRCAGCSKTFITNERTGKNDTGVFLNDSAVEILLKALQVSPPYTRFAV